MKNYNISLLFILLLILSSCSNRIFFSSSINSRLAQKELSINKVQFYNSQKIILRREVPQDHAEVTNGRIRFEKGKFIEEIIIKKNTPGTCEFVHQEILNVSFEQGYNKLLRFRADADGKYYSLITHRGIDGKGYLRYDTIQYKVQSGGFSKLWVRKDQGYVFKASQRVVEGKTVDEEY